MSAILTIRFAPDMPTLAVDVISPDLSVVERTMMSANEVRLVDVPSEQSFLRMHLPSGRTVILTDPGNLTRTVDMSALQPASPYLLQWGDPDVALSLMSDVDTLIEPPNLLNRRALREYHLTLHAREPHVDDNHNNELRIGERGKASIRDGADIPITGTGTSALREAFWNLPVSSWDLPRRLDLNLDDGREMKMSIPANIRRVWIRTDTLSGNRVDLYSIRLESAQPIADTIMNYLRRGDLSAAETMKGWAEQSERLLLEKREDPYGAAVGAYLLFRLGRFDLMRQWTRNLAEWFDYLSDGCVLWASQLSDDESRRPEVKDYLFKAVSRGVPVYTEGLRLLMDGLALLGAEGRDTHEHWRASLGQVVWTSPVTARVFSSDTATSPGVGRRIKFDIEFASPV